MLTALTIPTYGDQQLTFFHGYYDQYMYHPLLVYDADTGEMITGSIKGRQSARPVME